MNQILQTSIPNSSNHESANYGDKHKNPKLGFTPTYHHISLTYSDSQS